MITEIFKENKMFFREVNMTRKVKGQKWYFMKNRNENFEKLKNKVSLEA